MIPFLKPLDDHMMHKPKPWVSWLFYVWIDAIICEISEMSVHPACWWVCTMGMKGANLARLIRETFVPVHALNSCQCSAEELCSRTRSVVQNNCAVMKQRKYSYPRPQVGYVCAADKLKIERASSQPAAKAHWKPQPQKSGPVLLQHTLSFTLPEEHCVDTWAVVS